jgi:hypothetical protein
MRRSFPLLAVALVSMGFPPLPAAAQLAAESPPQVRGTGPAYTEPPAEDQCYPLMGEFVGEIQVGADQKEMLGLQIRPVGGDEFDALSFWGGLPGQDKYKPEPIRMIGRRSDDFVILSGGPWAIFVEKDSCLLLDRQGNKLGSLTRIQRTSPTLGARPPQDAAVLFDGSNIDQFTEAQMSEDGLLMQGAIIRPMFQDFNLHAEFRLPYMPQADGQSRGNSGLYLQSRYECQVLDSFGLDPLINGCGSLYKYRAPDLNMCFPPLVWQTYDVQFTAARWAADGSKIRDAHITTWLNGVKVQDNVALPDKTGAGQDETPLLLPIKIQDHGDPVHFRNLWIIDRGLVTGQFPIYPSAEELAAAAKAEEEQQAAELKRQEQQAAKAKAKAKEKEKEKAEAKAEDKAAKDAPQPSDSPPPEPAAEQPAPEPAAPEPSAPEPTAAEQAGQIEVSSAPADASDS